MKRHTTWIAALILAAAVGAAQAHEGDNKAAQRGFGAVRGQPPMNPPLWSQRAYDNLWKRWGLKEKPADYDAAVREQYGLQRAPYTNNGLPMGLHVSAGLFGKGLINDCLLCHAGRVAGQTVIGLGNASLDLQSLFDDLSAVDKLPYVVPVQMSQGRGVIDPVNPVTFLFEFRDDNLKVRDPIQLGYTETVSSDPPAWWLLKRKKTRNWTGSAKQNSIRIDMVNLLSPFNDADHIKKHETTFADIHAFVMSVQAPKYPFAVDAALAENGRGLFNESCARCHGTYGANATYPSKIVPLETLGTDPALFKAIAPKNIEYFNKTWFAQEKAPDGSFYTIAETAGYQAPPLDGVWATAPYFHNGSVPTIYDVLNSKARPKYFTRTYGTEEEDYDAKRIGMKVTVLDGPPAPNLSVYERRKICDTTQPGRGNAGHTFGDQFTDDERRAVIEYLKTL